MHRMRKIVSGMRSVNPIPCEFVVRCVGCPLGVEFGFYAWGCLSDNHEMHGTMRSAIVLQNIQKIAIEFEKAQQYKRSTECLSNSSKNNQKSTARILCFFLTRYPTSIDKVFQFSPPPPPPNFFPSSDSSASYTHPY